MADISVLSDINARVWKIEVAVGDTVAEGVKQILVAEENAVSEDQLLLIIEA